MPEALPLLDAGLGVASAALFAWTGLVNRRRAARDEGTRRALRAFAAWWGGLAVLTLATSARSLLAGLGVDLLAAHVALEVLRDAAVCLALWGLTAYLLFIYRGKHDMEPAARVYFLLLFALLMAVLWWTMPVGVDLGSFTASLRLERTLTGLPLLGLVLLILAPPPVLAVAYARLYPKARDPVARRRILAVSATIILWFGLHIVANSTPVVQAPWWPIAARVLALAAGGILILAYREASA